MTKNELSCKLIVMGYKQGNIFPNFYMDEKQPYTTVDLDTQEEGTALISMLPEYVKYDQVIKALISIDK